MFDVCNIYNSSLFYLYPQTENKCENKKYKEIFDIKDKTNKEEITPLESLFNGNAKYPYVYDEFNILLDEYNSNFAEKYNKHLSKDDFDSYEEFQKKGKLNIEYNRKNNLLTGFPKSPVDTYIFYGNFQETDVGFVYDDRKKQKEKFDNNE